MPPKKKAKTTTFSAKDRKCMIADLDEESHSDILDRCLELLQEGRQLKWNPARQELVEELTKSEMRKPFNSLTDALTRRYMDLLKFYRTGKRSAQFQQAWLDHIVFHQNS